MKKIHFNADWEYWQNGQEAKALSLRDKGAIAFLRSPTPSFGTKSTLICIKSW